MTGGTRCGVKGVKGIIPTFEDLRSAILDYLDLCIGELRTEDEKLKDAAREILGLKE